MGVLACVCACTDDPGTITSKSEGEIPVEISVMQSSRAVSDYTASDLSLTILYQSFVDSYTRTNVKWCNLPRPDGTPLWAQCSEGTRPMAWKSATDNARVLAYAPYLSITKPKDLANLYFEVKKHQEAGLDSSDFVSYYNPGFAPGPSLKKLNIVFNHQLCKLSIDFKPAPGNLVIDGFGTALTQGMLDTLSTCKVGPVCYAIRYHLTDYITKNATTDIHPLTTVSGTAADSAFVYTYAPDTLKRSHQECIIPPQTIRKDSSFVQLLVFDPVACKHHIFVYRAEKNFTLEPGKHYHLTIELGGTGLELSSVKVVGWLFEDKGTYDIN
ncbi:MAG: fimbrillin family protein [Prevotella sp.]|uniref:fimbrillin family protein n=1 Tax=Prevotella sp. AGR2160 TaxID=1280674 RepID=UPI0018C93DC3|nr:fimbrillin family protein [Prevotella sp. AGR2160]MDD5862957.1 fimbrillin family protein [Prevotella sp.]